MSNKVNGRRTSTKEFIRSAVIGGVAGGIAGSYTHIKGGYKPQTHYGDVPIIPIAKEIVSIEAKEITKNSCKNAFKNATCIRSLISNAFGNGGGDAIVNEVQERIEIFSN